MFGTEPMGPRPFPPAPPTFFAPSAAAINCRSFCGSFNHCLNSGPSVCAAICAAMLTSPVDGSAAMNLTSLIRMVDFGLSPKMLFDLLGDILCLRPAYGKCADQADEIVFRDFL